MPERVTTRAYEPVEVEINGAVFESVDPTEAQKEKLSEANSGINALIYEASQREDELKEEGKTLTPEEAQEWDGKMDAATRDYRLAVFDLILRPIEGGTKKPSTVLKTGLKEGKITPRQFDLLWEAVPKAIAEANGVPEDAEGDLTRPT